jgi:hypothetical protein
MKKETAVEWLVNELENHHIKIDIKNTVAYQQAKAMEKEQIMEAYNNGEDRSAELYYNETFKSE